MINNWILTKLYTFRFNSLALRLYFVSVKIENYNRTMVFEPGCEKYVRLVDLKMKIQSEMDYIRQKLGI